MDKEQIKNFFTKYKRAIYSVSLCVLALIFVVGVAIGTSNSNLQEVDENVQTSTNENVEFIMPIKNGTIIKDFSNTELKYNSTLNQWEAHKAIDIKGEGNDDVLCVYDGEVISIETNYLTGTVVKVRHSNSLETLYGSLSENVNVKIGDKLSTGDVIGKISNSAKSESNDGAHLHFEVIKDGVKVDPNLYLEGDNK